MTFSARPTWAEIDVSAIRDNVAALSAQVAPSAVCAVVKGDGYGHGAVAAARAALVGGATWLAVALLEEGLELRAAGIDAPVLLLSEPPAGFAEDLVRNHITPTIYSEDGLRSVISAVRNLDLRQAYPVHLKVDTGLYRLGATPVDILRLARLACAFPEIEFEGLYTHFAAASAFDKAFTVEQRHRLAVVVEALTALGLRPPMVHACNSAGISLAFDETDAIVRAGAVLYGLPPTVQAKLPVPVRPALALKTSVAWVKTVPAGESVAYGRSHELRTDSVIVTLPVGYADGVPRKLGLSGGEVLIGGRRYPIAGPAAMDQLLVDCGPDAPISRGDEVVLLGSQGEETIGVLDWVRMLDLSPWEVLTGISKRVPRVLVGDVLEPVKRTVVSASF